jgi:biotin carboxyl carrier protein/GAF domain-containing protein
MGVRLTEEAPPAFWPAYAEALGRLANALRSMVWLRDTASEGWKEIAVWRAPGREGERLGAASPRLDELAGRAVEEGTVRMASEGASPSRPPQIIAVRLDTGEETAECVALLPLGVVSADEADECLARAALMADTPRVYQLQRRLGQAEQDVVRLAAVLETLATVQKQSRFLAAAMSLVNELATRIPADRASLGWLEHHRYVRLKAISHTERFDRKMEAVRRLEYAMEEAADQDDEVLMPAPADSALVTRDHARYQQHQGLRYLLSVPVRVSGRVTGVVTCERERTPFGEVETRLLRIAADLAAPQLEERKQRSRWFGARWASFAREQLGKLLGTEHTWAKALGVIIAAGLAFLLFGRMDYRVEAPFILHTREAATVPAPFDGYLAEVLVEPGDAVEAGTVLAELDTRELRLEEASASADRQRYLREAEKARAEEALADMRIASALADQAEARLGLVRYRLEQSRVRAPSRGVVVEGDLRERIGTPVAQGDMLFRLALPAHLYAELSVSESDVHEVSPAAAATVAFASQPHRRFAAEIVRVDPVARPEEGDNIFTARAEFRISAEAWWRPGMSGVAKIEAGRRNVLWVFTHRTVDFLRMKLWW